MSPKPETLYPAQLGASWVVISRVISPPIWVISMIILLISLLITIHETPRIA